MSASPFEIIPFRRERRSIVDALDIGIRRHMVHALVEFDVTRARRLIQERKARTGEALSFTGFIVYCLGRAIDSNRALHAYRSLRNRLVLFDDVDVVTLVESELDKVAIPHIIRSANKKTLAQVHGEIRQVQSRPKTSKQRSGLLMKFSGFAPRFVRRLFFRAMRRNPHWLKRVSGTAVVTSVGMFGPGGGWGIGIVPLHTLALTLGGIAQKTGVVEGRIEIRDYLSVTISVDHDIVDGAPAARFVALLRELVERAEGIEP